VKRRLLNLLTLLSLLLCVAVFVLWGRGRRTIDVAAYRGLRLVQFIAGDGRLYVQQVRFTTRTGQAAPAPAVPMPRPGIPVRTPPLTKYDEAPGSFLAWAAHRDTVPWIPRLGRWEEEPSPGWRWTSEPVNPSARRGTGGRVRDWLVDARTVPAPAAGQRYEIVPGVVRLAHPVGSSVSVRFDRETGAARARVEEQWLTGWTAWAPLWPIVVATAALPAARFVAWSVRWRRGRRLRRANRCPACGYDLRATPDRCPECGAAVGAGADGETPRAELGNSRPAATDGLSTRPWSSRANLAGDEPTGLNGAHFRRASAGDVVYEAEVVGDQKEQGQHDRGRGNTPRPEQIHQADAHDEEAEREQ
jgi:hypothetical protein